MTPSDVSPAQKHAPTDGLSRRAVLGTAAWTVPAVVLTTASPAVAATGTRILLSTKNNRVLAKGDTPATAHVTDGNGAARAGDQVTFTGPSTTSFSPVSATTDSGGDATSTLTTDDRWATPGSTLTINAATSDANTSTALKIVGANAYGVGRNNAGQLGNGSTTDTSTPTQLSLAFDSPIVQLVAGSNFSLALLQDGTVWSVGNNDNGQLGDGTTTSRTTWARISGLSGVTSISAGNLYGVAVLSSGAVKAWGANGSGQLGDGTTVQRTSPVDVANISTATQVAAGQSTTYALLKDGTVRSWGSNMNGALGRRATSEAPASKPAAIQNLTDVTQISAGSLSGYALLSGGTIKSWGSNSAGQLGNGSSANSQTPVTVSNITTATQVVGGYQNGYALLSNGEVRSWGANNQGELGNGTNGTGGNGNKTTPVAVKDLTGVTQIAAGYRTGYALLKDGQGVRAWGANTYGQIGDGTTTQRNTAVSVTGVENVTALNSGSASGGDNASSAFFLR